MNSFKDAVKSDLNSVMGMTTNGMAAHLTTNSKVLDFFGVVGSSRGVDVSKQFQDALAENEELTVRTLLWTRDVRGGAGERQQFRDLLENLDRINPVLAGKIMHLVPVVGRADDLFSYRSTKNRRDALEFFWSRVVLGDALFAKWAPRYRSSAFLRKREKITDDARAKNDNARDLMRAGRVNAAEYRKTVSAASKTVETQMSAKKWDEIDFSNIPSLAAARYQNAFGRNAPTRYEEYIDALQRGEATVNAGAVYPYDVTKSVKMGDSRVAQAQWEALPNYIGDASILPMIDVSGSMGVPATASMSAMDVAVALGLYVCERSSVAFRDMFLTFESRPKFVTVSGTLEQRLSTTYNADWGGSTNIGAAYDEILRVAVSNRVAREDMPDYMMVLTDMQFDASSYNRNRDTAFEMARKKFNDAGYELPKMIFWNLSAAYALTSPVKMHQNGAVLISGFSPAIMKAVLSDNIENFSPVNIMLETIMDDRYDYLAA